MFFIGSHQIDGRVILAPMAGISDLPFRSLCENSGAAYSVSEMVNAKTHLWHTDKSKYRLQMGATKLNVVQIAGSDAEQISEAAKLCEGLGADVIDVNMGCPAKKVCNKAAGSALLRDEKNVSRILEASVASVQIPVTLKIRTGWDTDNRNACEIARIAENSGIKALTVHGRTRACRFHGQAEYDTIAAVVKTVTIPVIANGDIDGPEKAVSVLNHTKAAAVMVGRAARGNPWLFGEINNAIDTEQNQRHKHGHSKPSLKVLEQTILEHLKALYDFYGHATGVKIARKHLGWYIETHESALSAGGPRDMKIFFNKLNTPLEQLNTVRVFFDRLYQLEDQAA